jgi:hypothetical protein
MRSNDSPPTAGPSKVVGSKYGGSPQSELLFYPPSENSPYRMKREQLFCTYYILPIGAITIIHLASEKIWSPILIYSLRLVLVSRFSICVWVGPEHMQVIKERTYSHLGWILKQSMG